ncbi:uncharacterized protein LOC107368000 [Tetranychus urticae]|uniref:uncharacterized protein LOC107368000 n=1 Tax=Tetranychus urticae TaxID=32264 RepID=UPI00077BF255|nr:uncharacterized protein LOC107368000 [Tetranychus urticae]
MAVDRARTVLKDLYGKRRDNRSECHLLDDKLINDTLIYRIAFDPDEDINDREDGQLFNLKSPTSSVKLNGNHHHHSHTPPDMINVGLTRFNLDNKSESDCYNDEDKMRSNGSFTEPESLMYKSTATIILNVSSLAEEIIEAEMDSLKGLQRTNQPIYSSISTRASLKGNMEDDHLMDRYNLNYGNDEANHVNTGVTVADGCSSLPLINKNDGDNNNDPQIAVNKARAHRKLDKHCKKKPLFLPSIMRYTVSTDNQIITYNCPPTRACLSCCSIS